jgi:hypothetical protein
MWIAKNPDQNFKESDINTALTHFRGRHFFLNQISGNARISESGKIKGRTNFNPPNKESIKTMTAPYSKRTPKFLK